MAEKLKEVRDELSLQAEQFRRELSAKDSLIELLKVSCYYYEYYFLSLVIADVLQANADEYHGKLKDAQQIVDGTKVHKPSLTRKQTLITTNDHHSLFFLKRRNELKLS